MKLNFEIMCMTSSGYDIGVGETELTLEDITKLKPLMTWHKIFLLFDNENNVFKIDIDYHLTKEVSHGLETCHTFKSFQVRAEGETFVSFTCDPTSKEVDTEVPDDETDSPPENLTIIIAVLGGLLVFVIIIVCSVRLIPKYKHRSEEPTLEPVEVRQKLTTNCADIPDRDVQKDTRKLKVQTVPSLSSIGWTTDIEMHPIRPVVTS